MRQAVRKVRSSLSSLGRYRAMCAVGPAIFELYRRFLAPKVVG